MERIMDEMINEFGNILAEEENLLDRLTEKQKILRKSVVDKEIGRAHV